jgi:hypothetical protein
VFLSAYRESDAIRFRGTIKVGLLCRQSWAKKLFREKWRYIPWVLKISWQKLEYFAGVSYLAVVFMPFSEEPRRMFSVRDDRRSTPECFSAMRLTRSMDRHATGRARVRSDRQLLRSRNR